MLLRLQRATSFKSAAEVSGALALISNCQITFAWVISRRGKVPPLSYPLSGERCLHLPLHPLKRERLCHAFDSPNDCSCIVGFGGRSVLLFFYFSFLLSAHRKRRYLSDARSTVGHATRSLTHSLAYSFARDVIHFWPEKDGEVSMPLAARCAAQSSCNARLSL